MERVMSTLDILRTNVINGEIDERLLHLLRMKTLRNIEKICKGKVFNNYSIMIPRSYGKSISLYGNGVIKEYINLNLAVGILIFKRRILKAYVKSSDTTYINSYKNNLITQEEFKEKVKYYESLYKQSKKLKKIEAYIEDKILDSEIEKVVSGMDQAITSGDMFSIVNNCTEFSVANKGKIVYVGNGEKARHIYDHGVKGGIVIIKAKDEIITPWYEDKVIFKDKVMYDEPIEIKDNKIPTKRNTSYIEMNKKFNKGRR